MGPFAALLPAVVLGALSIGLLRNNTAASRGIAGFGMAVFAAPALLFAGIPLSSAAIRMAIGIGCSVALWLAMGILAARRATRSPVATWKDFWREFAWLAAGIWIGVVAGLVAIQILLGGALL